MHRWIMSAAAVWAVSASPALAHDQLTFGPPESWVVGVESPATPAEPSDNAFTMLLDNEQAMLGKGERRFFTQSVFRIDSPQGLDDGNITLTWDPATDTVVVHKLLIRRGSQVIDVLKSGQKFTTIRRETNLEAGMLDGQLTATLQPEGLQVGDIIDWAVTYIHSDPVKKDSTEVELATFNGTPIARGFARLSWPSSLPLTFRTMGDLPQPKVTRSGGMSSIQYDMRDIEPMVLPAAAPGRFRMTRALDASNFASWGAIASLMKPYFDEAAKVPATGPLRDAVDRIKRLPGGEQVQAEAALMLVQNDVRYVALNMGAGGYVPSNAETTWSRRFGDCKAKTALLLAILRELNIDAEAVLVNTDGLDGLDQMQPVLGWFNHVIVRARVGGKSYWIDGTRSGDMALSRLETPGYGWGLPLITSASLVRMEPDALKEPSIEVNLAIDARKGIRLPAPTTIIYSMRGDAGREANISLTARPPSQRERFVREFFESISDDWKGSIISLDPERVSSRFDAAKGEMQFTFVGKARLDWTDANFYLQFSSLAYKPDFERSEGVNREAPFAIEHPIYVRLVQSIRLPSAFLKSKTSIPDVHETLVGVEYKRHAAFVGDAFTVEVSERSIASEVAYREAIAASPRLRELNSDGLMILVPRNYAPSDEELAARMAEKPASVSEFLERGLILLDRRRYDEAIADFSGAIALNKKESTAYADRALAYLWKGDKERARADIEASKAIDPADAVMLRASGLLAEQEGKWEAAAAAFTASLSSDPGNSFARGHRAIANFQIKREDEALTDLTAALEKEPDWPNLHLISGVIKLKRGQCDDAVKDAQATIALAKDSPELVAAAAELYVACKRVAEGLAAYSKALEIKPSADIYINRAVARPLTDHAGRLGDFDAAIKLEPKKAAYAALKAEELERQGRNADALTLYDRAIKADPSLFGVAVRRAVLTYRIGQTGEGTKLLSALRSRAKDPMELNALCWEKATAGILLESALADCTEALKLKPDTPSYLDSLGLALLRLGRYDEAIAAYDKAISGGIGAISLMGRSIARMQKGDKAMAEADRKAALADDPAIADRAERFGLKF